MSYLKHTCYLPHSIEVEEVHSSRYGQKGYKRASRAKPTKEEMAAVNERNRIKKLRRLIATNFDSDDFHLILTYAKNQRPDPESAKDILGKFLGSLRRAYRRLEKELKYIVVTEYKHTAIHHHVIINGIEGTPKLVKKLWTYGGTHFTPIYPNGDVGELAAYLIKETRKSFKDADNPNKLAYSRSRNLKKPVIKTKVVKADTWRKELVPPAGYQIRRSDIVFGINLMGYPYRYYTMVPITPYQPGREEDWIRPRKKGEKHGKRRKERAPGGC